MANNFNTCDRGIEASALAANMALDTSTGTMIGTAANQLLGLWGSTGVDQPAPVASLTDNSGGTADEQMQSVVGIGTVDSTAVANNFADLSAKVNTILSRLREPGFIDT